MLEPDAGHGWRTVASRPVLRPCHTCREPGLQEVVLTSGDQPAPAPSWLHARSAKVKHSLVGLVPGGAALLLFVSEECPTSALARCRLAPLCRRWASAAVQAAAIFEDPLEVAIRVARRLGWTGHVFAEDPPYQPSRAYGLISVPTAVLVDAFEEQPGLRSGSVSSGRSSSAPASLAARLRRAARAGWSHPVTLPAIDPSADFEEVTKDFGQMICRVNTRFGTGFA